MNELKELDSRMNVIQKLRPFEGQYLKQLNDFFKLETTFSSNAIEGNTLTLQETKLILEDGITVGGHPLRELYEVVGHGKAYDYMFDLINSKTITANDIKKCHYLFSSKIPDFDFPGEYRDKPAIITGSKKRLAKPEDIKKKMTELIQWLNSERTKSHPVEFAAEAHIKLVNIHPFSDGNGRMSRLLMNTILFQERYFPVSIPILRRHDYYNTLEISKKTTKPFCEFITGLELQTVKDLMRHFGLKYSKTTVDPGTGQGR
jgi:Fic family protein